MSQILQIMRRITLWWIFGEVIISKRRHILLLLSAWRYATPCPVLSLLALSCTAQNKSLPNMFMSASKPPVIGLHNIFEECYIVQSVKWIFITIEKVWYVEHYHKHRQSMSRQNQTRQHKTRRHRDKKMSPGFENLLCQKQLSRAGPNNYNPQILGDVISCPYSKPALNTTLLL